MSMQIIVRDSAQKYALGPIGEERLKLSGEVITISLQKMFRGDIIHTNYFTNVENGLMEFVFDVTPTGAAKQERITNATYQHMAALCTVQSAISELVALVDRNNLSGHEVGFGAVPEVEKETRAIGLNLVGKHDDVAVSLACWITNKMWPKTPLRASLSRLWSGLDGAF